MGRFRKAGGEVVEAGTYWNFETGKKAKVVQKGVLPGKASQSYFKLPPMLILALAAAAAHLLLYVLPKSLVPLYEAHVERLVTAYVAFDYIIISTVLLGLCVIGFGELLARTSWRVPSFSWIPGRAYFAAPVKIEEEKPEDGSDTQTRD